MRTRLSRILGTVLVALLAAVTVAPSATAHGGATLAEGGSNGVRILLQATDSTTADGQAAVDLSTVVRGPGTDDATVTFWVRPAGADTFRVATDRDDAGVSHADVPTEGRGSWRDWDVSAVVRLDDGTRLRVSNAEANPPGPDPASTPGGGAQGPDEDSAEGTDTTTAPTTTSPTPTTDAAPATSTSEAPAETTTGSDDAGEPVADVTGEGDGAPGWVVPSLIVVIVIAVAWIGFFRRSKRDDEDPDDDTGRPRDPAPPAA